MKLLIILGVILTVVFGIVLMAAEVNLRSQQTCQDRSETVLGQFLSKDGIAFEAKISLGYCVPKGNDAIRASNRIQEALKVLFSGYTFDQILINRDYPTYQRFILDNVPSIKTVEFRFVDLVVDPVALDQK